VKGAYDPAEGNIYLDLDFDLASPVGPSYLLLELVHHFQVHNREDIGPGIGDPWRGRPIGFSCAGSRRRESTTREVPWASTIRPCASSSAAGTDPGRLTPMSKRSALG